MSTFLRITLAVVGLGIAAYFVVPTKVVSEFMEDNRAFCIDGGPNGVLMITPESAARVTRLGDKAFQMLNDTYEHLLENATNESVVIECPAN